jgi:GntR family transcriptional regulator
MFQVDVMSRTPIYEQLVNQVEQFVLAGLLKEGDKLPSVRTLSMELAVNPNTIQKAMSELDRRGIVTSVPGKGCFISESAGKALSIAKRGDLEILKERLREFKLAGVPKEEIMACVAAVFDEEETKK